MRRIALTVPLAALTLGVLAVAPAIAAPKPDATIKTRTIDASVTGDPALKAYPGLYPRLPAAGKRAMAK